jgi:ribulose-phosphate 3-epimerase
MVEQVHGASKISIHIDVMLHLCDVALILTVDPGFGGHNSRPETLPKIRDRRRPCASNGLEPWIEAYGGQDGGDAAQTVDTDANALVAGSAIFGSNDCAATLARICNSTSCMMAVAQ